LAVHSQLHRFPEKIIIQILYIKEQMLFEKIFLPLDFSDQSDMMVDCIAQLKRYGAKEVILFYAIPKGRSADSYDERRMNEFARTLTEYGIPTRSVKEIGDPASLIIKVSRREKATMIAMASTGKGRAKELLIGSVSLAVVRRSKVPVLLGKFPFLKKKEPLRQCGMLDSALIAFELAHCTKQLAEITQEMGDTGMRRATLFHVIHSSKHDVSDDKKFRDVKQELDHIMKGLNTPNCALETHIHFGTPSYNIIEAAREISAGVIVMGIQNKSFLHKIALGTTAEDLIRQSPTNLLLLPC
jgi:nucleotide-binding universal stress UspA family protein